MSFATTAGPDCRLDLVHQILWVGGDAVSLRKKTWEVLRYLAERPRRLVTKDELLDAVWPGSYVTDTVIKVCIREIRRALGEDARRPRFIQTVHGRGYRLLRQFPGTGGAPPRTGPKPAAGRVESAVESDLVLGQLRRAICHQITALHEIERRLLAFDPSPRSSRDRSPPRPQRARPGAAEAL